MGHSCSFPSQDPPVVTAGRSHHYGPREQILNDHNHICNASFLELRQEDHHWFKESLGRVRRSRRKESIFFRANMAVYPLSISLA